MKPQLKNSRGYTLIEVLITMVVLSVGILATTKLQLSFMQSNAKSSIITTGSAQTQSMIEQLIDLPYDHVWLLDGDGDGTGQDPDSNGVDNNGGNFGLDDIGAAADSPGGAGGVVRGRYTFYWNVAIDHPADETKTVKVFVQWSDEKSVSRSVNYSFIKAEM